MFFISTLLWSGHSVKTSALLKENAKAQGTTITILYNL